MSKKLKNILALSSIATLVAVGGVGLTLAYFTDGETVDNVFTVGDVNIEGLEKNYPGNDSNDVKSMVANKEVAKDPQVDNKGISDAVAFITVDSPMENITVIGDNGAVVTAKSINEIYWFKDSADGASAHANNFDSGWQELTGKEMYVKIAANGAETKVEQADLATTYAGLEANEILVKRYVFGYKTLLQGSNTTDGSAQTTANKISTPLFDKIQLKNTLENEIDKDTEKVRVRYFAIQGSQIYESGTDLTTTLDATNLGKIYDVFVRQNSNGDATGLAIEGLRNGDSVTATSDGSSGNTTNHVNRWDTDKDVSGTGNNTKTYAEAPQP